MYSDKYNKYDNVCIDIERAFKKQDMFLKDAHKFKPGSSTKKEYRVKILSWITCKVKTYILGALYKAEILGKLIYSNLLTGWFNDFREFWVGYLKNRPIDIIDFHYLRVLYRTKFQDVSHIDEEDSGEFIKTWQKHENISMLFTAIWKYAKSQYLNSYQIFKHIPNNGHILEYGCGIAPAAEALIRYLKYKDLKISIADIKQINFLYARWKLAQKDYVKFITIEPGIIDNLPQNTKYDAIICLTVFEHLNSPLETAKVFNKHLKTGGVLIFNYAKGEGKGLDTKKAVEERDRVLKHIEDNFKIIKGKVDYKGSMGLTIAKKIDTDSRET